MSRRSLRARKPLIDTLRDLRSHRHLPTDAAASLDVLIGHHGQAEKTQLRIDSYLTKVDDALQAHQINQDVRRDFARAGTPLPIDDSFAEWKKSAQDLIQAGNTILKALKPDTVLLQDTSETTTRLQTRIERLATTIGRDNSAIPRGHYHSLSEDHEMSEEESTHQSITL